MESKIYSRFPKRKRESFFYGPKGYLRFSIISLLLSLISLYFSIYLLTQ